MKVRFIQNYDHRWPSRAVTAFKAGYEGTVKRDVGEAAISKGKATEVPGRAKHDPDASGNNERAGGMVKRDTGSLDARRTGGIRGRTRGNGVMLNPALSGDKLEGDAQ